MIENRMWENMSEFQFSMYVSTLKPSEKIALRDLLDLENDSRALTYGLFYNELTNEKIEG